ncbi:hypothetical protein Scep_009028 [Stephania cephalantha]|uniref:Uncharacterized protein n=1 Tax=Stephania cephalantha TaxID=152367 RepID=A0AAP0JSI5_9MAGN
MMNLNEGNDIGSWPLYYENKLFNDRQFFNSFSSHPTRDVYLGDDKEVVKRMMLKHEAIFRNQVYELHCLYKMQRALMEELKRQEAHKYPISVEASHSNAHSSHKPLSDGAKIFSHFPSTSPAKSACSRASICGTEKMQSHLNFTKLNTTKADSSPQNAGNFEDCTLIKLKTRKVSRRTLDLQRPADEYIDSEEEVRIDEENTSQASVVENNALKTNRGLPPKNDINLFSGTNANLDRQGLASASKPTGHVGNKNGLVDLNQPILVEEASSSASVNNFLGSAICDGGNQRSDALSFKQNSFSIGFPGGLFQSVQRADKGDEIRHNLPSYKPQSGPCGSSMNYQDSGADRFPYTSKIVKDDFKEAYASPMFLLPDGKRAEPWTQNTIFGADNSARKSVFNHNLWGQVSAIPMVNQCLVDPDVSNSVSLSGSSMRKPINGLNQNQDTLRGVDRFNISAQPSKSSNASIQCLKFNESKWHPNDHLKSNSSFGNEVSNRRGSLHGFLTEVNASQARSPLVDFDFLNCGGENASTAKHFENNHSTKYFKGSDSKDVKSRKDMNLNLAVQNESQEGTTEQQDLLILDGETKNEDPLGALPWFRRKLDTIEHPISASHDADLRIETNVRTDTKKLFGVPILDKPHDSEKSFFQSLDKKRLRSFSEEVSFQSSKPVKVLDVDLFQAPTLCGSGRQPQMEKVVAVKEDGEGLSGSRGQFDLNSCANEEEPLALSSISKNSSKIVLEIDLEIPLVPETAETVFHDQYVENQHKMPTQSSASQDKSQNQTGEPVNVAAEILVSISSSFVASHSKYDIQHLSEASVSDSLNWFAELVSSCASALASEEGVISRDKGVLEVETLENSSDESDYFETMTLQLKELKVDEKWCEPSDAPDNQNDEETIANFLLPTRRRRGQARRGRQRRDFQRDILPSIASLSRHEVTEDLQTIGGLMRATGQPWQTALERRNAARNGWARGRRRSRGSASSVAEVTTCIPPPQVPDNNYISNNSNNNELGLEENCLKGWGKTTRRQRCQRFVAGNPPPVPLAQV